MKDPWPHLKACAQAMAEPGQPMPLYKALEAASAALIGHKLFTILRREPARNEVARIYTNNPAAYPVGGTKPLNDSDWSRAVIGARKHWLGRTMADIKWAFFDHELIASLGCGACINALAIHDGEVLGSINILDAEGAYDQTALEHYAPFAQLLLPTLIKLGPG